MIMLVILFFVQGGTLIEYEGKQRLLEIAQVPKEHVSSYIMLMLVGDENILTCGYVRKLVYDEYFGWRIFQWTSCAKCTLCKNIYNYFT